MSYFSEYYLDEFENDETKELVVIINKVEIHSKQKYLLIIAQDVTTHKIVKLIDTHGVKYDLCKYSDDWAKLKKGDVISVKCRFYKSEFCSNVLRIKSNYTYLRSVDFYGELKKMENSYKSGSLNSLDFSMAFQSDLNFLGKKLSGKYGFILYYLNGSELIEYQKVGSDKVKYQFRLSNLRKPLFADIAPGVSNIQKRIGQEYIGFVLLRFVYKNDRLRVMVYDFLNEESSFEENMPF